MQTVLDAQAGVVGRPKCCSAAIASYAVEVGPAVANTLVGAGEMQVASSLWWFLYRDITHVSSRGTRCLTRFCD